ncbi:acyl-CoA dehydrogenase family protein [Piscinibacter sakaiensis]|uniref:acyl-CoA dehydrogenase family protein n=1 Tax=Piscinibacter sakaiensis TaxID=1547922 RepID=UPI003AAD3D8F
MDFDLSEEQRAIAETTRRFVEKEMPRQQILKWVRDKVEPPRELFKKLGQLGYYGFLLPEAYSGLEKPDPTGMLAFVEQFARASSAATTAWGRAAVILAPMVAKFGSQAQKDLVLPKVMAGEVFMALGLSEPGSGSDAASLRTSAVKRADGSWVINGEKLYCSQAESAGFLILAARTDPSAVKQEGISTFLIEKPGSNPAIELTRIETMGLAMVPTFSANFRDLVVPPDAMIGPENKGWKCVLGGLDNERLYHGAIGVGASQAIIDEVIAYLKQRVQFGKPLSKLQSVRHKIVDMQLRVEAARLLVYRGASVLEKTGACHNEASFAKVAGAECYMHCAYTGLHLLGGYGYSVDSGLPMHFQDAKLFEIGGGAMEVQRDIIARGMGL